MVFLNYTTMQMTAKIVYYGPGLCGKTTNLHWIHSKTAPRSRGEMVSLETETDRTLFFDLLPLDVGVIGGMKVRLQLYTVPGQVFYNATRRLVLKGVDGVVFVADSQLAAMDANIESFKNLQGNLTELGLLPEQVPLVFQYNKRDLRNIHPVDTLRDALNPGGVPAFEAAALHGVGVFETLKSVSALALATVRNRIVEENRQKQPEAGQRVAPAAKEVPPRDPLTRPVPRASVPAPRSPAPPAASVLVRPPERAEDILASLVSEPAEVKVEFAEEDTDKHAVRPVSTKAQVDIQEELHKLRTLTDTGSAKGPVRGEKDVDKLFQQLLVSDKDARQDVKRKATLDVPSKLLKGASDLRIHVAFTRDGQEEVVKDAVTVKLIGNRRLERLTLHLDLELKSKG
jgi:signal recognition particle receptor subunit beta